MLSLAIALVCLVGVYVQLSKARENFESVGRFVLEHVDPRFGHGGLLIPIVHQGQHPLQIMPASNNGTSTTRAPTEDSWLSQTPDVSIAQQLQMQIEARQRSIE